jgi:hypothetical protein
MNTRPKQLFGFVALTFVFFAAGCGGGSGSTPPSPTAKFSDASLSGQYAFSMAGNEVCAGTSSYFARAGSFTADGKGNITAGLEDVNVCPGVATLRFTGGKYSIGSDGRGSLKLTNSTGTTNYSIALSSSTAGAIAQTDAGATASGSFQRQNRAAFLNTAIAGGYVFDLNGVDVSGTAVNPASSIGRFDADGAGAIFNGLFDSNIGGSPSGQQLFPAGAFCQLDTTPDGANFGRGTANIAGQALAFYVVDATRLKFIGTDFPSAWLGEAFSQQNVAFNTSSLNGSFAFLIGGSVSAGPISTAGRFAADGAGNLSNIALDENNSGSWTPLPSGSVTGAFTVDSNQFGGGTLTWTDTKVGTFSFIFYLISPTQAVLQETDSTIVSDGILTAQTTTPISGSTLAGDYVLGWTGFANAEEDYIGQVTLGSSGSLRGLLDVNDFFTHTQFFDVSTTGNLSLSGDGTQFNDFSANLNSGPAPALHFTTYVANPDTSFLVGVDSDRVISGTLTRQP